MFISAYSFGSQWPGDGGSSLLDGADLLRVVHKPGHDASVRIQLFPQLLHALEETLALVQREFRLREGRVQGFFASEKYSLINLFVLY